MARVADSRAGDADDEHVVDVVAVEQALHCVGRVACAHAGDDPDDVALPHPSEVDDLAVDVGLDQVEVSGQGASSMGMAHTKAIGRPGMAACCRVAMGRASAAP